MTDSGALSASADYSEFYDYSWSYRAVGSQFYIEDNSTVYVRFSIGSTAEGSSWGTQIFKEIIFSGSTTNTLQEQELLYSVQVLEYNTENVRYESDWIPVNTRIPIYALNQPQGSARLNSYRIYIRRRDGGVLTPSSMRPCVVTVYGNIYQNITQQTIPADWFETTTQTVPTVATTTIIPDGYNNSVGTVPQLSPDSLSDPPSWFAPFNPLDYQYNYWFVDLITSGADFATYYLRIAADLKFIWVFAGFVIIGCLLAWLLH